MAETTARDQGGQVVSLAGLVGSRGLEIHSVTATMVAATVAQIPATDKRVYLILVNTGGENLLFGFGADPSAGLQIAPGQSIQIDKTIPWCGIISLYSAAGTTIGYSEAVIA